MKLRQFRFPLMLLLTTGAAALPVGRLAAQAAPATLGRLTQRGWADLGLGGANLGITPEASVWYAHGLFAVGARWSKTVRWFNGSGNEHEATTLAGVRWPLAGAGLVIAGGLGRAAGCVSYSENQQCTPLRAEWTPAWSGELVIPFGRYVGAYAAGFGVEGRRVHYRGACAGLSVGRLQ